VKRAKKIKGGFSALATVAARNILRNRRRTVLCAAAVGIAVFFNIFMQSWMDGMLKSIEDIVRTFDTGHVLAVSKGFEAEQEYMPVQYPLSDGEEMSSLTAKAEAIPGVRAALPRIAAYASLFDSVLKHATLWGIDIDRELGINNFNLTKKTSGLTLGRFPRPGTNECAIGYSMAKKGNLEIGDTIPLKTVSSQFSDKYWSPVITGIFTFDYRRFDEDTIIVPIDRLQRILGLDGGIQQLAVYADDGRRSSEIRDRLRAILTPDTLVREWSDNYWVAMFKSMTGLFLVIFGTFQIVASFLIINTMLMVIHERIKEIGMMGALGMTRGEIVAVFFLEAVFLSILGALAGSLAGGLVTWTASLFPLDLNTFTGGGMKDMPMSGTLYLAFSFSAVCKGFFFGVAVSALCTILPSMKSAFIEPVEALRR
jgi:putative ABC transport system permease protein